MKEKINNNKNLNGRDTMKKTTYKNGKKVSKKEVVETPVVTVTAEEIQAVKEAFPEIDAGNSIDVAKSIAEQTIVLKLGFGKITLVKQEKASKIIEWDGVAPDEGTFKLAKELLPNCIALKKITTLDNGLRNWIYRVCLASPFKRGLYLIPITLIPKVDAVIQKYIEDRKILVNLFVAEYEQAVLKAKENLGTLWNKADYVSPKFVAECFTVDFAYMSVAFPQELKGCEMVFAREDKAFKEKMNSTAIEMKNGLRVMFKDMVEKMLDRLTVPKGEKPRIFHDSLIKNMDEFITMFADRNILKDVEIAEQVEKMRGLIKGKSADELRENLDVREYVRSAVEDIDKTLVKMAIVKPKRKILWGEDEETPKA